MIGSAQDEASIREILAGRDVAWNTHDATSWASFFAEDARFTSWRGDRAEGRENIRIYHDRLFKSIFRDSTNANLNSRITFFAPDLAIAESVTFLTGAIDPAGNPLPDRHYYPLAVFTKNNGRWEIVIFHNVRDQT